MKIYHLGERGQLIGEGVADADPMNAERWLIPANAVTEAPIGEAPAGHEWRYTRITESVPGVGIGGESIMVESSRMEWTLEPVPAPAVAEEPQPPTAEELRRAEILAELAFIDARSIRPLREGNAARVAELEAQAVALRLELAGLGA